MKAHIITFEHMSAQMEMALLPIREDEDAIITCRWNTTIFY